MNKILHRIYPFLMAVTLLALRNFNVDYVGPTSIRA
jgi:hypothetical protein